MKVKRFSTARDKELKCTDPESYIDENGILYPRLAKMPIQDLSLIANFRVEMMKRYYTGNIQEVDYPIVELLMDQGEQICQCLQYGVHAHGRE